MSYLQDCFQIAKEINQSKEKMKSAVEKQCRRIDAIVRPGLTAEQNESLSVILEEIISSVAENAFNVGYNNALHELSGPTTKIKPPYLVATGRAAIEVGLVFEDT